MWGFYSEGGLQFFEQKEGTKEDGEDEDEFFEQKVSKVRTGRTRTKAFSCTYFLRNGDSGRGHFGDGLCTLYGGS